MIAQTDTRYDCGCILKISFSTPDWPPCFVAHCRLIAVRRARKPYYSPFLSETPGDCPKCANSRKAKPANLAGLPIFEV